MTWIEPAFAPVSAGSPLFELRLAIRSKNDLEGHWVRKVCRAHLGLGPRIYDGDDVFVDNDFMPVLIHANLVGLFEIAASLVFQDVDDESLVCAI